MFTIHWECDICTGPWLQSTTQSQSAKGMFYLLFTPLTPDSYQMNHALGVLCILISQCQISAFKESKRMVVIRRKNNARIFPVYFFVFLTQYWYKCYCCVSHYNSLLISIDLLKTNPVWCSSLLFRPILTALLSQLMFQWKKAKRELRKSLSWDSHYYALSDFSLLFFVISKS